MSLQDELQAAVSSRASKTKTDRYSYSDDFNEDEDGEMAEHQNINWLEQCLCLHCGLCFHLYLCLMTAEDEAVLPSPSK